MAAGASARASAAIKVFTPQFTIPSFAKINWSLRILGKRGDGYHELRTVLQTVSLHDNLHFAVRDDDKIVLTCNAPDVPGDEKNLIVRAAAALRDRRKISKGANLRLEKRIPTKGGLGGASSNAAIGLLGLAQLWDLELSATDFSNIGRVLGADVPFFFIGGRALGLGTGTELTPLSDGDEMHLLIVTPNARVSTAEAYSALKAITLTTSKSPSILSSSRAEADLSDSEQWPLRNDFEDVIFEIEPEIKRSQKALLDAGARGALLAGSGSSVFGIFDSAESQQRGLEEIQAEAGWRIFSCQTLSRSEYVKALGLSGAPLLRSSVMRIDNGA